MRTWIVPVLIALALTGCSSEPAAPQRTVADSLCESGERILKFRPKVPGIKKHGVRWREAECLPVGPVSKKD